jgi:hypothetical protein
MRGPGQYEAALRHFGRIDLVVRFRLNAALAVAAFVATLGSIPLASQRWFLVPILLVPASVAVWAWRAGTDVDTEGLRVRALFGSRFVPWTGVASLRIGDRERVYAETLGGGELRLTGVTAADVPRVVAASGQELRTAQ